MMTLKDKRQYLSRYKTSEMRIKNLEAEIESLRSLAERTTQSFNGQPGGGAPGDRVGVLAARIADDECQIKSEIADCLRLREEIRSLIQGVADEKSRELLRMRYICGDKIWQMAAALHYDERSLRRKLNRAVNMIDFNKSRPQKPLKDPLKM